MPKTFTDPNALEQSKTLVRKLIPTADSLRDLLTKFGMRPYTIKIIRVKWTGGERGVGMALVVPNTEFHLLPVPKMVDLEGVTEIVTAVGLDEVGSILVTQISPRYTEEQLRGWDQYGNPPGVDEETFYEIEFIRTDNLPSEKRRFFLRTAPQFFAGKLQWQLRLERSHQDRDRDGTPAQ